MWYNIVMKIYIDGQNFLYKASDILIEADLISNKDELRRIDIRWIMQKIFTLSEDDEILFFGAKIKKNKKYGEEISEKLSRFSQVSRDIRNSLQSQGIEFIESGQLRVRSSDKCHNCGEEDYRLTEKGVDIGLGVKMVEDKLLNDENNFVLISSDTDLLPAVKSVRENGGKVTYVGFEDRLTKALIYNSDRNNIIRRNEIIEAYKRANEES